MKKGTPMQKAEELVTTMGEAMKHGSGNITTSALRANLLQRWQDLQLVDFVGLLTSFTELGIIKVENKIIHWIF